MSAAIPNCAYQRSYFYFLFSHESNSRSTNVHPFVRSFFRHKSKPKNSIKSIIPHYHNLHHHSHHHTHTIMHIITHNITHNITHKTFHTNIHYTTNTIQPTSSSFDCVTFKLVVIVLTFSVSLRQKHSLVIFGLDENWVLVMSISFWWWFLHTLKDSHPVDLLSHVTSFNHHIGVTYPEFNFKVGT